VKCLLKKHGATTTLSVVNVNIYIESDSNESKSLYGPVLHSLTWMPYSYTNSCGRYGRLRGYMCIVFEGLLWKTKNLNFCGPCTFRYHLSCVSDTEYQYYTGSGISAFNNKCASCVKDPCLQRGDDTPAQTRSASISDLPNRDNISWEISISLSHHLFGEVWGVLCASWNGLSEWCLRY
jgi:hypothetical protein